MTSKKRKFDDLNSLKIEEEHNNYNYAYHIITNEINKLKRKNNKMEKIIIDLVNENTKQNTKIFYLENNLKKYEADTEDKVKQSESNIDVKLSNLNISKPSNDHSASYII